VIARAGNAGSNTPADHIAIIDAAIAAIPAKWRHNLLITIDGAGSSHAVVEHLTTLNARAGASVAYSVGFDLDEALLDGHALRVVLDDRLGGEVVVVGDQDGWCVAAEPGDHELAYGAGVAGEPNSGGLVHFWPVVPTGTVEGDGLEIGAGEGELSMIEIKEILRLWLDGRSLREVTRLAGVDRKTARRYVETARACGMDRDAGPGQLTDELLAAVVSGARPLRPSGRGASWQALAAQHEQMRAWLEQDLTLNAYLPWSRCLFRSEAIFRSDKSRCALAVP